MTGPFDHAEALAAHLATTDLASLELRGPGGTLRLVRRGGAFRQEAASAHAAAPSLIVHADGPGIFLTRHPLRAAPLAEPGNPVKAGAVLGFLRVGPLLTPITAPASGIVADILLAEGALAGYGAPLFTIEPDAGEDAT